MAAIIQIYQEVAAVLLDNSQTRPASDEELRRMFPSAPAEVLRYSCCFPEEIRALCAQVPCGDRTLEDVIWELEDGHPAAFYIAYWNTSLLYVRTHRDELRANENYATRGNYDTLLYELYRLCWEAMMSLSAQVRRR